MTEVLTNDMVQQYLRTERQLWEEDFAHIDDCGHVCWVGGWCWTLHDGGVKVLGKDWVWQVAQVFLHQHCSEMWVTKVAQRNNMP